MSTLKERLQELMDEHGLVTQQQLADFAGVSKGLVGQWFAGSTGLGKKPLLAFDKKTRFSTRWLADGTGDKYKPHDQDGPKAEIESNVGAIGSFDLWSANDPLSEDDYVYLPFYKDIALSAGDGSFSDIDYNGFKLPFAKSTLKRKGVQYDKAVCVSVTGNSMEPVLPDGSTVSVDMGCTRIIDGKMYAINQGGLLRVKRLYALPNGQVRINSYNADEHPDAIESITDVEIIGRVFNWSVMD